VLAVSGVRALLYGADVGVSVALRGAGVGGLVGRLIRVQWLGSTLGGECLAAMFVVLPLQSEANGEPALSSRSSPEARR
jgi:hypothetical protein